MVGEIFWKTMIWWVTFYSPQDHLSWKSHYFLREVRRKNFQRKEMPQTISNDQGLKMQSLQRPEHWLVSQVLAVNSGCKPTLCLSQMRFKVASRANYSWDREKSRKKNLKRSRERLNLTPQMYLFTSDFQSKSFLSIFLSPTFSLTNLQFLELLET